MGGSVKKVVGGLGVDKVIDAFTGGSDQAEALRQQAEQQRIQYEQQLRQQNEAAKLSASNTIDNVLNVQTGDALAAIDGLTSSKKKRMDAGGVSSALGVA